MKLKRLTLSIATMLAVASPFAHADGIVAKQLAGAPSEFASMQPADPADAAIHSKSALLPVTMRSEKSGGLASEVKLPVEGDSVRFLVFSGDQLGWTARLSAPGGRSEKAARALASDNRLMDFGTGNASVPTEYYALEGVEAGEWTLKLAAPAGAPARGFVLLEGQSDVQLVSYQTHTRQLVGERIGFVASLYGDTGAEKAARTASATLRVTHPDGQSQELPMFDDGLHADGAAGDGIFGGDFLADKAGQYLAQVTVRGHNAAGRPLVRSAEHPLPVLERSLRLAGTKAAASGVENGRLMLNVPVSAEKAGRHYRGYAEVWGTDAEGNEVPVAWVGGMVSPQAGHIGFGLDQRWIALAGARAPFELRKLRLEDPDSFVSLAQAERLPLSVPALHVKAKPADIVIDEAMTMGARPAGLLRAEKGTGSRLLLVHGYCSGGVWPTSHFSNASTFLDANQNRSHDQFARLIQSFGATWNSFGVVAHSQGGAASLHLYTYYWSGLDNATGARLIQSVGTPYQGTNLAGILATLGSWFGVGCSTNNDLTYSGAAAWLAGIPTWARAKVNYYTTSFKTTNWYTNDYCQFATDLVLSDPEDGTTEQAKGQLSGAVNRGHVTGQCHTSGMRDPAQYLNASRNATMNSNAAR